MKHPSKLPTTVAISRRMSNVKLKGGLAEVALAKALWHQGIRYRRNYKSMPGSPDIAITKYKIAIFIDGEFWHGFDWENRKKRLKSNREYWIEKIEENIARDARNDKILLEMGWSSLHFWEKEVKQNIDDCVARVMNVINSKSRHSGQK